MSEWVGVDHFWVTGGRGGSFLGRGGSGWVIFGSGWGGVKANLTQHISVLKKTISGRVK